MVLVSGPAGLSLHKQKSVSSLASASVRGSRRIRELQDGCFDSRVVSSSSEGGSSSTCASELKEGWTWMFNEVILLPVPKSTSGGGLQPSRKASRGQEVYWISCLSVREHKMSRKEKKEKRNNYARLCPIQQKKKYYNNHHPFFLFNTIHNFYNYAAKYVKQHKMTWECVLQEGHSTSRT